MPKISPLNCVLHAHRRPIRDCRMVAKPWSVPSQIPSWRILRVAACRRCRKITGGVVLRIETSRCVTIVRQIKNVGQLKSPGLVSSGEGKAGADPKTYPATSVRGCAIQETENKYAACRAAPASITRMCAIVNTSIKQGNVASLDKSLFKSNCSI